MKKGPLILIPQILIKVKYFDKIAEYVLNLPADQQETEKVT